MDILKRQLRVILAYAILVVLLLSADCAAQDKILVFVGNDSYPPICYQEGGKPKGLAIEIVRALGQRMGRQIEIRLMEWKVAQEMVAQGKADALCQLSITEARKQIYDFSDQAHDLRFSIFVRTGKQGIDDLSDLRGLQVAAIAGSVQYNIAMADPQIKFTLTTNDIQSFQLLTDGKVDAVVADLWTGSYVLAENGITGIQVSGEPFAHLASAIAVKKGNTALLAAIDDGLRSLQADGTIERINEKWRPKEIIFQTREQAVRKTYSVVIGVLVLLVVVGAFWLITLKRQISERRRVEAALRESDHRYQSLFEQASDGIFILDKMGEISAVNKSFASMHGYTVEEIRNLGLGRLDVEGLAPAAERIRRIMNGETLHFEVEHYHKDGHTFSLGVTANLVKFGNELLIIANHRDLTERKRAEAEKQNLKERLLRAEKMEVLGTLAGGVAHDLNNVLGIVMGYAEMLMDDMDKSSPMRDDLMKIMEGANRSAAIVQDLLTLARRGVQSGQVINLNDTIMNCQKTPEYQKIFSFNQHVSIETHLEADTLNIMASPVHLAKTFINLVSNAVEAMTAGGILTIMTSNQSLDKPVHGYDDINVGDYVVLSITDTGEGISDSDIKRIFEPFYTKKVMGRSGTGLGLAVVWGTVKDYNGYIEVQSEVGKGTTFTLYFPLTREEIAKVETTIPLSEYIGNDESILVIDDIKEQRELAAKMLGKLNYRVKIVASGEEAVEVLRTKEVDLIVLDMIMAPGMDGLDTYKAILEIHPRQKAIIVSGFSETDKVEKVKSLGAGYYLRKPYIQEKLGLAVRKELDRQLEKQ